MITVRALWIGKNLPLLQQLALRSYLYYGHGCELFTYENVQGVPSGVVVRDGREILPEEDIVTYQTGQDRGSPSLFANLFRYKYLYDQGGTFVDADTVCLSADLPTAEYVFSSESTKINDRRIGHPNLAYVRMPAGTACMRFCYQTARQMLSEAVWGSTGPKLLLRGLQEYHLTPYTYPAITFCPLPYNNASIIVKAGKYTPPHQSLGIHLWNQILVRHRISRDSPGPAGCLFHTLLQRFSAS